MRSRVGEKQRENQRTKVISGIEIQQFTLILYQISRYYHLGTVWKILPRTFCHGGDIVP